MAPNLVRLHIFLLQNFKYRQSANTPPSKCMLCARQEEKGKQEDERFQTLIWRCSPSPFFFSGSQYNQISLSSKGPSSFTTRHIKRLHVNIKVTYIFTNITKQMPIHYAASKGWIFLDVEGWLGTSRSIKYIQVVNKQNQTATHRLLSFLLSLLNVLISLSQRMEKNTHTFNAHPFLFSLCPK